VVSIQLKEGEKMGNQVLKTDNLVRPTVRKERITVTLDSDAIRNLDDIAMVENRSRSSMLNLILNDMVMVKVDEKGRVIDEIDPREYAGD
jgi:hypothetical protein